MIEVTVPEGQGVGLVVVQNLTPEKLFSNGGTLPVYEAIKKEVAGFVGDVSTEDGRKEIAALARKIARSKTFIDDVGKTYNARLKALPKEVDAERKRVWDALESLQAEIRKPLTEWEEKEKARVQAHKDALSAMEDLARFNDMPTTEQIKANLSQLEALSLRDWEENAEFAATVAVDLINSLNVRLAASEKADKERAELEKLRAEAAQREAAEAARLAKEQEAIRVAQAEEKARVEAKEAAQKAIEEARAAAAKAEADRIEAAARADQARIDEHERALASLQGMVSDACSPFNSSEMIKHIAGIFEGMQEHKRDWQEYKDRADSIVRDGRKRIEERLAEVIANESARAEQAAKEAAERAEREKLEAIEAERRRAEEAAKKEADEAAKREADKDHRKNFNNLAVDALVMVGLSKESAKMAIAAIAKGIVPNVKINY